MIEAVRSAAMSVLRCVLLVAVLLAVAAPPAAAQFLGLGSATDASSADYGALIEKAIQDGSTVVVISPEKKAETADSASMMMTGSRFLEARKKFVWLVSRSPALLRDSIAHFENVDPAGSHTWFLRGVAVAALGIACALLVNFSISRWMRRHFAANFIRHPETQGQKISGLLLRSAFAVLGGLISFAVAMLVAIAADNEFEPTRATIFSIVATFVGYRMIRYGFLQNLFAPDLPRHRLVTLPDDEAKSLDRATAAATLVSSILFGMAVWSRALNVPADAQHLIFIVAILACGLLIAIVSIAQRHAIGSILVGTGKDKESTERRRFLALLAVPISVLYLVFAVLLSTYRIVLGLPGGFLAILAPVIIIMFAVASYGITFVLIDWFYTRRTRIYRQRYEEAVERNRREQEAYAASMEAFLSSELNENEEMRMSPPTPHTEKIFEYQPLFREFFERSAVGLIVSLSVGEFARLLGVDVGRDGGHPLAIFIDVLLIAYVAYQLLRVINRYIDRKIEEEGGGPADGELPTGEGEGGVGQSRLATLLPIARNVLVSVVVATAITIGLSAMGVDVAPLFAGAGVVGIAVGFGAQTLIRDMFSGAFFLMDDAFRKGEYVALNDVKGVVEKISIRSFQLRHHLGALHTVPFGEIQSLTNFSRDWVMMKLPIRLTYDTDIERVRKLVKKLGQELLDHPEIGHSFLQPLKSQGVYKMEDSAMIIRVKFMTKPGEQFMARKVIYQRIRELFEAEGITFAHKEVTVRLRDGVRAADLSEEEKEAISGAARAAVDEEEAAQPVPAHAGPD